MTDGDIVLSVTMTCPCGSIAMVTCVDSPEDGEYSGEVSLECGKCGRRLLAIAYFCQESSGEAISQDSAAQTWSVRGGTLWSKAIAPSVN